MDKRIETALEKTLNAIQSLCTKNAASPDEVQSFQDQFINDVPNNIQVQYRLISVSLNSSLYA